MAENLVIVESPSKAKTIQKYLGDQYNILASVGHVRDLPRKKDAIDIENNFTPRYEISADKKAVIRTIKKAATKADKVYLATDLDREGEAIAWHLMQVLDLHDSKVRRITFNEITRPAIQAAIKSPTGLNTKLVNAQQARRILDRLVGFELSPLLWKKIRPSLSAGRVQSVAVRLIVERENEIEAFKPEISYKVSGDFSFINKGKKSKLNAELVHRFKSEKEAE